MSHLWLGFGGLICISGSIAFFMDRTLMKIPGSEVPRLFFVLVFIAGVFMVWGSSRLDSGEKKEKKKGPKEDKV